VSERLRLRSLTGRAAERLVKQWHRHLPDIQGKLFAVGLEVNGELCGVAVAGNPPRVWQGTGRFVISRVAVNNTKNGCTKLYGAICRAAEALGYEEAWTYTLPHEPGTSLLAAGFVDMGMTSGGEHDRSKTGGRYRRPARHAEPKRRWVRKLYPNGAPASAEGKEE